MPGTKPGMMAVYFLHGRPITGWAKARVALALHAWANPARAGAAPSHRTVGCSRLRFEPNLG